MQRPLLILGDSPAISGGLSRIGRDLAFLLSGMEEFRVGFLGRGGLPSRRLPFMQYTFPEMDQWGEEWLRMVWENFAGGEYGIVFTIWDPSRLMWFSNPVQDKWLQEAPFKRWGYFPIDHEGPGGRLTVTSAAALAGYDRILAYGVWGSSVISRTLELKQAVDFMPHGINLEVFKPRDAEGVKIGLGLEKDTTLLGVVMTNQTRKDWGLAFETIALLKQRFKKLRVWCKTDSVDRNWDLRALNADFHTEDVVLMDLTDKTDEEMSYMYSACDLTFLPSLGEGFGYPIVESLACGTPCIHGNYGGGAELVPENGLVEPITYRFETRHDCKRPVYRAVDWANKMEDVLHQGVDQEVCRNAVAHLDWAELHTVWKRWFREGL